MIETCANCKSHGWNTRHDEKKYFDYFNKGNNFLICNFYLVSAAIVERIPHAVSMHNSIPKSYLPYDMYCNLVPNSDPNCASFVQVPRTGAFEVSFKGLVSA